MSGTAQNAYILGRNNVPIAASDDGHYEIQSTFKLIKRAKRKRISATGTQLNNLPCAGVLIHNPVGNSPVYWGGLGDDAPSLGSYSGDVDGIPIYEGMYFPIPVDNANKIILIAEVNNTEIQYVGLLNKPYNVKIEQDSLPPLESVAPTVSETDPANTETGVERNKTITVTMNEALDATSVNTNTITISPIVTMARYLDPNDDTKIILKPENDLDVFTDYLVTLLAGGVRDLNGNTIAAQYVFTFRTKSEDPVVDTSSPEIIKATTNKKNLNFSLDNIDETSGPTDIAVSSEIIVDFDEPIDPDFVNFVIYDRSLSPITPIRFSTMLTNGNSRIILRPSVNLKYSTLYSVNALGTIRDLSGNELCSPNTSSQISFLTTEAEQSKLIYNEVGEEWETLGYTTKGVGLRVSSTHMDGFFNDSPKDVTIRVKRFGNFASGESNTMTCAVYDKDLNLKATVATYTGVTTIDNSLEGQNVRFQNTAQTYQMQDEDVLLIVYDDGDADDHLLIKIVDTDSNPYTNLVYWNTSDNALYDKTAKELGATIFG